MELAKDFMDTKWSFKMNKNKATEWVDNDDVAEVIMDLIKIKKDLENIVMPGKAGSRWRKVQKKWDAMNEATFNQKNFNNMVETAKKDTGIKNWN